MWIQMKTFIVLQHTVVVVPLPVFELQIELCKTYVAQLKK